MLGAFAMPSAGQNRTVRDRQGQSRTTAVNGRNGANGTGGVKKDTARVNMPDVIIDEEVIPDSLLHPRWRCRGPRR